MIRDARTCRLTPAGLALADFARELFEQLRQTRSTAQSAHRRSQWLVSRRRNIPGGTYCPHAQDFLQLYPQVSFNLEISDSEQIYNWLESKRIDFGIVGRRQTGTKAKYTPLASDELLIVIPANHPWAGQTVEPEQLYNYPFVNRELGSGTRATYERALRAIGIDHRA